MDTAESYLGTNVEVEVDRPLGSRHPEFGWEYELNYGFVPGTMSADGEEIDAYIIGADEPLDRFTGKCIAVIRRLNDEDDKLVIAADPEHAYTAEEIREATDFQEKFFESEVLLGEPAP